MKKVLSILLSVLLLVSMTVMASAFTKDEARDGSYIEPGVALPGVASGWTRYEAEDADEIHGSNNPAEAQAFYSNGKAVGGFLGNEVYTVDKIDFAAKNIPYVKFTVNAAAAGTTKLTIAFNGADDWGSFVLEVNGGEKKQVSLPQGGEGANPNAWNKMGTVTTDVTLKKGANTIYVSRCIWDDQGDTEGPWRNIDFIDVKDIKATATTQKPVTNKPTTAKPDTNKTTAAKPDNGTTTGTNDVTTTTGTGSVTGDGVTSTTAADVSTTVADDATTTTGAKDANTGADNNGSLTWLWFVIGGVVVLAGAGVAVYFLYFKKKA